MKQGQERSYGSNQQQKRLIGQAAFWERVRSLPYGKLTDGIIVGAIGGGAAILFRFLLHQVSSRGQQMYSLLRANSLLLAPALVVVIGLGLLAGWLVEKAPLSSGSGIPQVVGTLQGDLKTRPWPILVSKYVGGLASNLIGMSLGREGPSIQLGAEGAQLYAGLRQLPRSRRHMLMVAGAAAGLSAAFNAPLAAVVFTVEELRKEFREKELPIIAVASLTADFLSKMAFGWQPSFIFAAVPKLGRLPMRFLIGLPILALLCGVLGCLFNIVLVSMQNAWKKQVSKARLRVTLAFVAAFGSILIWPPLFGNGAPFLLGEGVLTGEAHLLVLLLVGRLLFTCFCYGSSTPGGIFLPTLVLGGMAGAIFAGGLGLVLTVDTEQTVLFIIIGMAAMLAAVTRSLMTAILLVLEMTQCYDCLLPLAIAALIAFLCAEFLGVEPIYETLLSKIIKKNQ